MAVITPPRDFWPPLGGHSGTGVFYASPPLFIAGNTMSISVATDTQPGYVTATAQPFAGVKDFTDGLKLNTGVTVTDISTDATMTGASDSRLATQKAIKDYIDNNGGVIDSVVSPLYITLGTLHIYEAGLAQSGIVTTGTQFMAGEKTWMQEGHFNSGLDSYGNIELIGPAANVFTEQESIPLVLRSGISAADQAKLELHPNAYLTDPGAVRAIPATGSSFKVIGAGLDAFTVTPSTKSVRLSADQLNYVDFIVGNTGDLTINSSGNDCIVHTSDVLRINNNTNNNGVVGTGAVVIAGGLSAGGLSGFYGGLRASSIISPTVRTDLANTPLVMFAGTNPGYSAAQGAMVTLQDLASGGYCDIAAAAGKDIRFYTGSVPPLNLKLSLTPTAAQFTSGTLINVGNTTQSTAYTNGSVVTAGGLGVAKDIWCNGVIHGAISGSIAPTTPLVLQGAHPQLLLKDAVGTHTAQLGVDTLGDVVLAAAFSREVGIGLTNPFRVYSTIQAVMPGTAACVIDGGLIVRDQVMFDDIYKEIDLLTGAHEAGVLSTPFLITGNFAHWTFTPHEDRYLFTSIRFPPDCNVTRQMTIRLHWYGSNSVGPGHDTARLRINMQALNLGENLIVTPETTAVVSAVVPAKDQVASTWLFTGIIPGLTSEQSYIRLRVGREGLSDAADTYLGALYLFSWTLSYASNTLGRTST